MQKNRFLKLLLITALVLGSWACQKKGDFINEDGLGVGMHYYPVILNEAYYDTVTDKYFDDTTFSPGQNIVFQLQYSSQDSLSRIELWIAETGKKAQKVWDTAYSPSFYSEYQGFDTTYIAFDLPGDIDSTVHTLTLYPKVVTRKALVSESSFSLELSH